jgi:hypothetical protein
MTQELTPMKRLLAALAMPLLFAAAPAGAQTNVGVSIGVHQPGLYGRIDIGNVAPPVVYSQPVIYAPTQVAVHQRPIYLYVPGDQQRQWGRYCGRYAACGQPVYFVQERWVRERWQERDVRRHDRNWRDDDRGHGRGHDKGHGRGHDRDDDRGRGHGRGRD